MGFTQPREYNWGATWKKKAAAGLEIREYGRRYSSRWPCDSFYPQALALSSPTRWSVGLVLSRTKATELLYYHGYHNVETVEICLRNVWQNPRSDSYFTCRFNPLLFSRNILNVWVRNMFNCWDGEGYFSFTSPPPKCISRKTFTALELHISRITCKLWPLLSAHSQWIKLY
jgi:hypothetical protein